MLDDDSQISCCGVNFIASKLWTETFVYTIRQVGIGHTRWATHGEPTEPNAHPHTVLEND